jgi:hypothetical protein
MMEYRLEEGYTKPRVSSPTVKRTMQAGEKKTCIETEFVM